MKVVGRRTLRDFGRKHADARSAIAAWVSEVEAASWAGPADVKERYPAASFLADNVIVFNVKGNTYRLEVKVAFETGVVVVTRIGTHAEYDRWSR